MVRGPPSLAAASGIETVDEVALAPVPLLDDDDDDAAIGWGTGAAPDEEEGRCGIESLGMSRRLGCLGGMIDMPARCDDDRWPVRIEEVAGWQEGQAHKHTSTQAHKQQRRRRP